MRLKCGNVVTFHKVGRSFIMHSKTYLLIKDWVDIGHAVNTAKHAGSIMILRNPDNQSIKDWAGTSFRNVTCKVTEEQFEKAKEFGGYDVVTEMAFDGKEVALMFHPRTEWPKFFKFLQLYR
jgi:hypothetical protein